MPYSKLITSLIENIKMATYSGESDKPVVTLVNHLWDVQPPIELIEIDTSGNETNNKDTNENKNLKRKKRYNKTVIDINEITTAGDEDFENQDYVHEPVLNSGVEIINVEDSRLPCDNVPIIDLATTSDNDDFSEFFWSSDNILEVEDDNEKEIRTRWKCDICHKFKNTSRTVAKKHSRDCFRSATVRAERASVRRRNKSKRKIVCAECPDRFRFIGSLKRHEQKIHAKSAY